MYSLNDANDTGERRGKTDTCPGGTIPISCSYTSVVLYAYACVPTTHTGEIVVDLATCSEWYRKTMTKNNNNNKSSIITYL